MASYWIETMGCQMNERDSETIAGLLEREGYARAAAADAADVLVVNTCSVRENADNRFFGLLGHLKAVKDARPEAVVAVCGCMMQQAHIVERIREKHGWVDLVFGTHNIHELPEMLAAAGGRMPPLHPNEAAGDGAAGRGGLRGKVHVRAAREAIVEGLPARRAYGFKAYVNIMVGCNNFCSYCIVPYVRGREMSREPEAVLDEVRALAESGTKEVMLLGQNVNSYAGFSGRSVSFPELLRAVDAVPGIERVRFMTSHPKDLSEDLIALFERGAGGAARGRGLAHLCPSIHLPVQAGSSRVLARMNRRYTKEAYLRLVEKLRAANPEIVITTDFIVGFPGETEDDFAETMDLIERVRYDAAFTFLYSPREGTPAAAYPDQVDEAAAHARFDRMVARLNEISLEKNRRLVGRVEQVLVEGPARTGEGMLAGRTFSGRLVNFPGEKVAPGDIVAVRITDAKTFSFGGELVE
ncbi:MAG: tRNA (N6-isopentenyl adenosine(37)-C2)-methylthiotransferase MiaB [Clostridiales Family XIII bacterium]|jgi:tRNA-2-methylthio-N6-dimethylallyladenosine synthase|nr:tRNA (N6-isopentenyl adenosine(37)-C2)-methylthiotransferase MiaB [Clostridiales Family XIII bacterium]